MPWDIITTASGDADPGTAYLKRKLVEFIRANFDRLESVCAQWRRGSKWIPIPFAIAMPKEEKKKKLTSPEEGAELLWSKAIAYATEHDAREVRFEGFGSSASGDSALRLFFFSCKPFEAQDEEKEGKKEKLDNVAIEAANVLKDLVERMGIHLDKHHARELGLLDKAIALLEKNTATTEQFVIGLSHAREMQRDTFEHEERMESAKHNAETIDKLTKTFGGPLGNVLERWLAKTLGLDAQAFTGSFAQRLLAIVKHIHESENGEKKLEQVKTILGDDAWSVLQSMSRAANDDAFRALGEKFLDLLGDEAKPKLQQIAAVIGQGPAVALLKLIQDAGLL